MEMNKELRNKKTKREIFGICFWHKEGYLGLWEGVIVCDNYILTESHNSLSCGI